MTLRLSEYSLPCLGQERATPKIYIPLTLTGLTANRTLTELNAYYDNSDTVAFGVTSLQVHSLSRSESAAGGRYVYYFLRYLEGCANMFTSHIFSSIHLRVVTATKNFLTSPPKSPEMSPQAVSALLP